MNLKHPSTNLLFVTTQVLAISNNSSEINLGTGFIIAIPENNNSFIPVLVTNQHIIKNAEKIFIELYKGNPADGELITNEKLRIEINKEVWEKFQSEELDITFIPLGPILQKIAASNIKVFYRTITPDLTYSYEQESGLAAIEEVIFIGYPAGIKEKSKHFPIIRRGITATPIWAAEGTKRCEETFLIDAGVFPGSSGSPVFIYNQGSYSTGTNLVVGSRIIFLGMIKSSHYLRDNKQFIGLGEVIKSQVIFNFIKERLNVKNSSQ